MFACVSVCKFRYENYVVTMRQIFAYPCYAIRVYMHLVSKSHTCTCSTMIVTFYVGWEIDAVVGCVVVKNTMHHRVGASCCRYGSTIWLTEQVACILQLGTHCMHVFMQLQLRDSSSRRRHTLTRPCTKGPLTKTIYSSPDIRSIPPLRHRRRRERSQSCWACAYQYVSVWTWRWPSWPLWANGSPTSGSHGSHSGRSSAPSPPGEQTYRNGWLMAVIYAARGATNRWRFFFGKQFHRAHYLVCWVRVKGYGYE